MIDPTAARDQRDAHRRDTPDGFVTIEDCLYGEGTVMGDFLRGSGCACDPWMVDRTTIVPASKEPTGWTYIDENGEVQDTYFIGDIVTNESVLAHDESCPLWRDDPFDFSRLEV